MPKQGETFQIASARFNVASTKSGERVIQQIGELADLAQTALGQPSAPEQPDSVSRSERQFPYRINPT